MTDTYKQKYPLYWGFETEEVPEFKLAEKYTFDYFSGPVLHTGSVWVKSSTPSGKSLRCLIKLNEREFKRTIRIKEDQQGEYILLPADIIKNKKVRP